MQSRLREQNMTENSAMHSINVKPLNTIKKSIKRLVSCGTCKACTRSECGNCINCLDKLKFGGQGIRKQCCINRRCLKLKQHVPPPLPREPLERPHEQGDEENAHDLEQQLFWTAVAGCMKLNTGASVELPSRSPTPPTPGLSRSPSESDLLPPLQLERPSRHAKGRDKEESAFCFKLASLLASDGTLASKPIAVRLMSSPSLQPSSALQKPASLELLRIADYATSERELALLRASLSPSVA